jgi:hypothetical protein
MKITWGEIKTRTTNLGFADAADYEEYISMYPEAANYALLNLAATVAPIRREYSITQIPLKNLLESVGSKLFDILQKQKDDLIFTAENQRSYYFECDGSGILYIEKDNNGTWENVKTITLNASREFEEFRGLIDASGTVRLRFGGSNAYNIRNIAMYEVIYSSSAEDVPAYSQWIRYDIAELTKSMSEGNVFMRFSDDEPIKKANYPDRYERDIDYRIEGNSSIVFARSEEGQYIVPYYAYPAKIKDTTGDNTELDVAPEAAVLVPLLMAYHIWLDEDMTKATLYFNEYQNMKMEIYKQKKQKQTDNWYSSTGWWR